MYIAKWERDLGIEIDEDKQRKIYRLTHENVSMREVEMALECWRGCGKIGTLYHIWWECPKIQGFWETIVHLIGIISEIKIGLDPELCLLHSTELSVNKYKDSGIWYYLNAAKGLISRYCHSSEVLREEDWVERVNQICRMEKL
ncbi:unnamed protein product, partial [Staurois parvus]